MGQKTTDSALCSELRQPINQAVSTTIEKADQTPPEVVNDWTLVVRGYDAGCKK